MKFIYYGPFSGGRDTHVAMGVGFSGREPSETNDPAAISWLSGNPLFVEVPEDKPAEPEAKPKAKRKRAKRK